MSLAVRRRGAPRSLRIPAGPATLSSRRLSTISIPTPVLNTYGLEQSLFVFEPSPAPTVTPKEPRNGQGEPTENHERQYPRILIGPEPRWAVFYKSSSLWSVHLLEHVEQTFPLQPITVLTPHRQIIRVWEAHIGAFDISHPSRLEGKSWLLPSSAQTWWSEAYTDQIKRRFPRIDIVFLLHRAEDVIASLTATEGELRRLKESLYWLMAERTPSVCSSVASSHTFPKSPSLASNSTFFTAPLTESYTLSVLHTHLTTISVLRLTLSAIHRLPPLLVVIRSLLQYLRSRARIESAAIAARERARTNTPSDAGVIQYLGEMASWHVAPEMRLEELEGQVAGWFERGERGMRELSRLAELVESRVRSL